MRERSRRMFPQQLNQLNAEQCTLPTDGLSGPTSIAGRSTPTKLRTCRKWPVCVTASYHYRKYSDLILRRPYSKYSDHTLGLSTWESVPFLCNTALATSRECHFLISLALSVVHTNSRMIFPIHSLENCLMERYHPSQRSKLVTFYGTHCN